MIEVDKSSTEPLGSARDEQSVDVSPAIPSLELQPRPETAKKDRYRIEELLNYHDRTFVTHVYAALLKREPTRKELVSSVDDLRSGRRTKIEIVESLLAQAGEGRINVTGLSSPAWRGVRHWPVIGYVARWLAALIRLPKMVEDQQRFESYALGQQQSIADHVNEVLTPAVNRLDENSSAIANLSSTLADALESLLMLSESLIELTGRYEEFLVQYQADLEQHQSERARHQAEHLNLQKAQTEHAAAIQQLQSALATTATTQQEFLVQEQRVIVETQKVVLAEFQRQLEELAAEQRRKIGELEVRMREMQGLAGAQAARAGEREDKHQAAPKSPQA